MQWAATRLGFASRSTRSTRYIVGETRKHAVQDRSYRRLAICRSPEHISRKLIGENMPETGLATVVPLSDAHKFDIHIVQTRLQTVRTANARPHQ
jgi:hypothetical protein